MCPTWTAIGSSCIAFRSHRGPVSDPECCRSSVVEHSLGKGEVVGSIPTGSTTLHEQKQHSLSSARLSSGRAKRGSVGTGQETL
jgi:hypothetical protein